MGDLKIQDVVCSRCERNYGQDVIEALTINNHGHCQLCRAELSGKFATGREQQPAFSMRLPLPPSVNHYWGYAVKRAKGRPFVHCYLTSQARAYRNEIKLILQLSRNDATPPLQGKLKAVVTLHQKTKHKTDVDNFNKGLLDALTHAGVYHDDSQIDELIIKRGDIIKGGQVDIELYAI